MFNNLKPIITNFYFKCTFQANKFKAFCIYWFRAIKFLFRIKFKFSFKHLTNLNTRYLEPFVLSIKNVLWIFTALVVLFTLYQIFDEVNTKTVYIDLVNLPVNELNMGMTQESVTENVTITLNQILSSEDIDDSSKLNIIIKKYKMADLSCYSPYSSGSKIEKFEKIFHFETMKKNEISIASNNELVSFDRFLKFLKNSFGKTSIELMPNIISLGGMKYKAQVNAKYKNNYSHKSELEANSFQEAEDKLALLVLKYSNPLTYASNIFSANPSEAAESIILLMENDDESENTSLPYTLLGNLYLDSEFDPHFNNAKKYFNKALEIDSNDKTATLGLISANVSEANNEDFRLTYKHFYENDLLLLDKFIKDGFLVDQAYAYKYSIYMIFKVISEADKIINDSLHGLNSNTYLQIMNLEKLIFNKDYAKAESQIDIYLVQFKNANLEKLKRTNYLNYSFYSTLIFYKLKLLVLTNNYDAIHDFSDKTDKCTKVYWVDYLVKEHAFNKIENITKLERLINFELLSAERSGVDGFKFYATWGAFLLKTNLLEESKSKFLLSLDYPGDHSISYFNIASIFRKQKMYEKSEEFALKSIHEKITPEALNIYFKTLYSQNKYKEYIQELWIREKLISVDNIIDIQILAAFSECILGNNNEVDNYLSIFKSSADKLNFDQTQEIESLTSQCT